MAGFDVDAARKAGYSDDEILKHLTSTRKFDVEGAVKSGYSKEDVISHLSGAAAPPPPAEQPGFGQRMYEQTLAGPVELAKGLWNDPKGTVMKTVANLTAQQIQAAQNPTRIQESSPVVPIIEDVRSGNLSGAAGGVAGLAGLALAPKVIPKVASGTAAVAREIPAAAKGAVAGAKAPTPLHLRRGGVPISVDVPAAVAGGMVGAATGAMAGVGAVPGAVVGAAIPIVKGAVKGVKASIAERAAAAANAISAQQRAAAHAARVATVRQGIATEAAAVPVAAPVAAPAPVAFPSGRVPGTGVPAPEPPPAPVVPAGPPLQLLDDLARSQVGKPFNRLSGSEQAAIRSIAERIQPPAVVAPAVPPTIPAEPPAPPPIPPSAPQPVAAAPVPPRIPGAPYRIPMPLVRRPEPAPVSAAAPSSPTSVAEQLRDAMVPEAGAAPGEVVTIAPAAETAGATAAKLKPLMEQVPPATRTEIAKANYREGAKGPDARAAYESAGRQNKAERLATALLDSDIPHTDAVNMELKHWRQLTEATGEHMPSEATIRETLFHLKKLEQKRADAAKPKAKSAPRR